MSNFKNCTHVVKTLLCEGTLSYKAIANEARKYFPDAKTTDKSVASIARDMRKAGTLIKTNTAASTQLDALEEQLDMFQAFDAAEFQLTLI
jgi:hypothetical protein